MIFLLLGLRLLGNFYVLQNTPVLLRQVRSENHSEYLIHTKFLARISICDVILTVGIIVVQEQESSDVEAEASVDWENIEAVASLVLRFQFFVDPLKSLDECLENGLVFLQVVKLDLFQVNVEDLDQQEFDIQQFFKRSTILHIIDHRRSGLLDVAKVYLATDFDEPLNHLSILNTKL